MLSVQSAGCAGMERLGVPTRTSLNTPPDDRDQFRCRMRVDALQARELMAVRGETVIRSNSSSSSNNQQQQQHHHNNKQQHSHHQHHLYQQQQQQQHQRMTTPHNSGASGVSQQQLGNSTTSSSSNNNYNNNNSINHFGSNVARGGIEGTTLKYGNGSYKGGGGGEHSFNSSTSTTSSCGSLNSHSNDHHQHYQYQLQQQQTPRCPHHVPLPDSEYGPDRHLQIRSSYQQSEITRSYTKPPPNKTVRDVPEQISASCASSSYRLTTSSASTLHAAGAPYAPSAAAASTTTKSKPNAITKFFSRISSPKSPTALASTMGACGTTGSSLASSASMSSSASSLASSAGMSSCVSNSSSASSLAAAPTLPIANAATLKSTACSFGANVATSHHISAGLAPSTQLLTSLGTPAGASTSERIPTPPLSVSVPIGAGLQILKSSSCNLPAACESLAVSNEILPPATTMSRNNSNSSMMSMTCNCNCNSRNCTSCAANTANS